MVGKMEVVDNKYNKSSCRICGEIIKDPKRIVVYGGTGMYNNERKFYYHVDCVRILSIKASKI